MSTPAASLPRTWYAKRSRAITAVLGVVVFVGLCVLAVMLPEKGGWGLGSRLGVAATGVLGLGAMLMLGRPKVVADASGVTVVNLLRTTHLEWAQIVRVYLRQGDPWVYIDMSNGDTLPVMGIQTSNGKAEAITAARELRALSESYGTATEAA
ncbi:PH domain-containing protein [Streptomyces sp. SID3343]|uniref:PH domain-containing protein n=1 Tax=Streptomyces sp. SID3343 TaxID=2690260 RepID=UPI0013721B54|nr:PH domain-containing protein [Streptomyces sp. SID3343]MYV98422.1 PH domain-containing protein [Streptomyces sp. SID3343]